MGLAGGNPDNVPSLLHAVTKAIRQAKIPTVNRDRLILVVVAEAAFRYGMS